MSGTKYDQGKAPLDLIPFEAQVAIAQVLAFGEKKYSAGNWAKGISYRRLISAAQRHIGAFNSGQDKDEESGLSHIAHAACCLMFLLYMEQKKPEQDDRWAKGEQPAADQFQLQVGKRYRTCHGGISGPLQPRNSRVYPFRDPVSKATYTPNGRVYDGFEDPCDLVEEVKE